MTRYKRDFDMKGSGDYVNETAGENLGNHKLVYRGVDGYWYLADADAAATMPVLGITMGAITATRRGEILLDGYIGDSAWTWTGGSEVYASTTAGELTAIAPAGAGDIVQVVAIAVDANIIQFTGNVGGGHGGSNTLEGETAFVGFDNSKSHFVNYFVCDGVADDVQIQAAIDYLPTVTGGLGGEIILEKGDYSLDASLVFDRDIIKGFIFRGVGTTGVELAVTGDFPAIQLISGTGAGSSFNDALFCDFTIDGTTVGASQHGISAEGGPTDADNVSQVNFERIEIKQMGANGINFENVFHCYLNNVLCQTNSGIGFNIDCPAGYTRTNVYLDQCWAINNGSYGFYLRRQISPLLLNCQANSNTTAEIFTTGCFEITVENCYIEGPGATGMSITGYSGLIIGNYITGTDDAQFAMDIQGEDITVIGNRIVNNGTGNKVRFPAASVNCLFDHNYIEDRGVINQGTENIFRPTNNIGGFVDAGTDTITAELPIYVKDPDGNIGTHPAVVLSDGADITVYDQLQIPLDFHYLVTATITIVPAASGDLRRSAASNWGKLCSGEAYNAATDTIAAGQVAVDQDDLECIDVSTLFTGIAAGDQIGFTFTREGSNVNDTVNADCYYLGGRVRYV